MAATSYKKAAERLLKCFCGCTRLTVEEVERIYRLNSQATLNDKQAVKLLKSFLKQQRSGDNLLETEQLLNVYQKCEKFLGLSAITLDELNELSELGMPYNMEKELHFTIKTEDCSTIKCCLLRIQGECRDLIEESSEYKAYRQAIHNKLKKR